MKGASPRGRCSGAQGLRAPRTNLLVECIAHAACHAVKETALARVAMSSYRYWRTRSTCRRDSGRASLCLRTGAASSDVTHMMSTAPRNRAASSRRVPRPCRNLCLMLRFACLPHASRTKKRRGNVRRLNTMPAWTRQDFDVQRLAMQQQGRCHAALSKTYEELTRRRRDDRS